MTISGHTSGAVVIGVTSATTTLAGLIVIARLITRVLVVRKAGIDDVCILIAIVRHQFCYAMPLVADTSQVLSTALTITMCQQGNNTLHSFGA